MKIATILRSASTDQGTRGVMLLPSGEWVRVLELPWRDNQPQLSCIPEGKYTCVWHKSPKFGMVYQVTGVPGRGDILIHPGNHAGDTTLGYKTHSHGCLLPCTRFGAFGGQTAGLISVPVVRKIADVMGREPFLLEVRNA